MGDKANVDVTVLTHKVIDRVSGRRNPSTFPRWDSRGVYDTDTSVVKFSGMDLIGVENVVTVKVKVSLKGVRG
jgi:hypothetical protein